MENEISLLNKSHLGVKMTLLKITRPTWSRAKDLDINKMNQGHAGIIPYVIDENGIAKFCFGVCYKTGELIELGGKREKDDIDIENTALRCFREETLGIFNISKKMLRDSENVLYLYDESHLVILVQINPDNKVIQKFNQYNAEKATPRFRTLTWVHELEVSSIITFFSLQMPLRLRCLLRDVAKFIPILKGSEQEIITFPPGFSPPHTDCFQESVEGDETPYYESDWTN